MNAGDQPSRRQGGALEAFWRTDGAAVYAVVAGDVDMDNADHLSYVLMAALREPTRHLIVDLTNLGSSVRQASASSSICTRPPKCGAAGSSCVVCRRRRAGSWRSPTYCGCSR